MSKDQKHILFITPSLANTGSEILLFNYINFLAKRYVISVICYKEGDLIKHLDKSVTVHIVGIKEPQTIIEKIIRKWKFMFVIPSLLNKYKNYNWYINTIVLPLPVDFAIKNQIKFTLHAHELKQMYGLLSPDQLFKALNAPSLLIANSETTKQHLLEAGSGKEISVINPFIDFNYIKTFTKNHNADPEYPFCWVMAGSIDSNKNPKLFIEIAKLAKEQKLSYQFIWLYNTISDENLYVEVTSMAGNNVQFIKTNNYSDYLVQFSKAEGLLLTSTFESFSMVTLEALALNKAIVVNDCGGVTEIVDNSVASIIDAGSGLYKYIDAMKKEAERVSSFNGQKLEVAQKYDKESILLQWEKVMLSGIKQ